MEPIKQKWTSTVKPTDLVGKKLHRGDIVAFGADNGSTLMIGRITKFTPQYVWMVTMPNEDLLYKYQLLTYRRAYDRVVRIQKASKNEQIKTDHCRS